MLLQLEGETIQAGVSKLDAATVVVVAVPVERMRIYDVCNLEFDEAKIK